MASFPSLYRAQADSVNAATMQAFIPQVFGDSPVTVSSFIGVRPIRKQMGWVFFQGGDPSLPVWTSGIVGGATTPPAEDPTSIFITRSYRWVNLTTASDPGSGKVKVNNLDPTLATELYISDYDLDGAAFLTLLSLTPGDLIAIYLSGDVDTRIEYAVGGDIVNDTGWLIIPLTLGANHGFAVGTPGNNAPVKVTVETTGTTTSGGAPQAWSLLTPLLTGWDTDPGCYAPGYRKVGDLVYLRGSARFTGTYASNVTLATLPVGFRPTSIVRLMLGAHKAAVDGAWSMRGAILVDGSITLNDYSNTDKVNPVIYLDSIPPFSVTA